MASEIKLSGGEITLLKRIGLSGGQMSGRLLVGELESGEVGEFLETLRGLMDQGFVLSNKVNVRLIEDAERAFFRVNPSYAKDLRDAVHPARKRERDRAQERRPRRR